MKKYAERIDVNQPDIVNGLRAIPGVSVAVSHDDILVGRNGVTYWFEIKNEDTWKKKGGLKAGTFKDSQKDLMRDWDGHYMVVWNLDQVLAEIGL